MKYFRLEIGVIGAVFVSTGLVSIISGLLRGVIYLPVDPVFIGGTLVLIGSVLDYKKLGLLALCCFLVSSVFLCRAWLPGIFTAPLFWPLVLLALSIYGTGRSAVAVKSKCKAT